MNHSVGLEIEQDIVHANGERAQTSDLVEIETEKYAVWEEIYPQTVEIKTKDGDTVTGVVGAIYSGIVHVENILAPTDRRSQPFGCLPTPLTQKDRETLFGFLRGHAIEYYQKLLGTRDGSIVENLWVNGLQMHVGHTSNEILIQRYNAMRWLIPFFSGICMSSPISNGIYRWYYSERLMTKRSLPLSGVPPVVRDEEDANLCFDSHNHKMPRSTSPGYYLMRLPRFDIGTVEMCSSDMTPDIQLIASVVDLYHRISKKIDQVGISGLPEHIFWKQENIDSWASNFLIDHTLQSTINAENSLADSQVFLGNGMVRFGEWTQSILEWIRDIPSELEYNINASDKTDDVLNGGTISEMIIENLIASKMICPDQKFGHHITFDRSQMEDIVGLYRAITESLYPDQDGKIHPNKVHEFNARLHTDQGQESISDSENISEEGYQVIWTVDDEENIKKYAHTIYEISLNEDAILTRDVGFLEDQIRSGRSVLALNDQGEVIGFVWFIPLSEKVAEIGGAWVKPEYRSKKVYQKLREELKRKSWDYTLISTNKPAVPGNEWAHVVNARNNMFPVPYSVLKEYDQKAYEGCCSCSDECNHVSCPVRENGCYLLMEPIEGLDMKPEVEKIFSSDEWKNDVPEKVQTKVIDEFNRFLNFVVC